MKKNIAYCIIFLCLCFEKGYAQKIDLDKEIWTHNYVSIPKKNDLTGLKTYSITMFANMDNLNRIGFDAAKIESYFKLDGFVYTKGLAEIQVEVTIENLRKISEEVITKESSVYEGGKNVTKKFYIPTTGYAIPTTIKVTKTLNNEVILDASVGGDQNPVIIVSGEFATYEAANTQLKGNAEKRLESFKEKYHQLLTSELSNFKEKYDFTISKESDFFWHVDIKKYPEFAEFKEKLTAAKEIFASQSVFEDIKTTRIKVEPIMQYLRDNADKLTADDKKNRKLKYAYLVDLAKIQLWLEMLDESAITAQQVIDNDYDKLDGKNIVRAVNLLSEELKRSPNGSRHLTRDGFTSATKFSASEIQPIPFKLPTPPAGFKSYSGTMTTVTGEQNKGALWAKANGVLSFELGEENTVCLRKKW